MYFPTADDIQGKVSAAPALPLSTALPEARPMARPLVPVTLALMAGIAAPAWGLRLPEMVLVASLVALWGALAFLWWRQRPVRVLPLVFFCLLGVAFYQQAWEPRFLATHLSHLPDNQELTLWGHLSRPAKLGSGRVQLFMAVEAWRSPRGWRPAAGNLLVVAPSLEPPPAGTGLVVRGRLRHPGILQNPGTFNRPRYLAADGIFQEMRLKDASRLIFLASTEAYPWAEKLRGGIRQRLREMDPTCGAIYLAMLLGDQGEITPEMRRNFARTGTSHLLVINGLHLGMVALVTYFLSFWLLRRIPWLLLRINVVKLSTLLAAFPVMAYAWMAGGSPSTQRAEIMVLAYLLLVFLGRPGEVWSALALAALAILSLTPLRLFAISFQLSFVAVAVLLYLVPRLVHGLGELVPKSLTPDSVPGPAARLLFRAKEWLAVSVVATVATAPLVAAYFNVVSLLGILVNLVAIPLTLLLALPLGEAAVFAQALSLTPVAQVLLALGKLPLWLGYQTVQWGAQVPGSAIVMSTPTWLQIGAYYLTLILIFAPRRTSWTWAGVGLGAIVLASTAALPLVRASQPLEITCLDAYGGLRAIMVTPDNRRLVVSAVAAARPGQPAPGWGPLPRYCHWRQFRRLHLVMALNLSEDNAAELLTLAEQFTVDSYWCGRRDREGPAYWDLRNYLGDRAAIPRSLEWDVPPAFLGSVALKYLQKTRGTAPVLEIAYQGRRVMLIPPERELTAENLPASLEPLEVLVLPVQMFASSDRKLIMERLKPKRVVIYGDPARSGAARSAWPVPCQFTRKGAVSLYLHPKGSSKPLSDPSGVTSCQWQP